MTRALVLTARPRQWAKNLLVFAAPGAAGILANREVFLAAVGTFIALCLASSGTYFVNDVADVEADRRHPTKQRRPIAAGIVPTNLAVAVAIGLIVASIIVAGFVSLPTAGVVTLYIVLTVSYSVRLKHQPVLDLMVVAAGFLLRAIAGGVATETDLSQWFLLVVGFGSLFVVAVKRSAEYRRTDRDTGTRAVLYDYSESYLNSIRTASMAVTLGSYSLWAFERSAVSSSDIPWSGLSIIPVVYGLFRYEQLAEQEDAESPEDLIFGSRSLIVAGFVWLALFALSVRAA